MEGVGGRLLAHTSALRSLQLARAYYASSIATAAAAVYDEEEEDLPGEGARSRGKDGCWFRAAWGLGFRAAWVLGSRAKGMWLGHAIPRTMPHSACFVALVSQSVRADAG